jgi:hypothetical protein
MKIDGSKVVFRSVKFSKSTKMFVCFSNWQSAITTFYLSWIKMMLYSLKTQPNNLHCEIIRCEVCKMKQLVQFKQNAFLSVMH